jgi:hypothetical protein
MKCSENGTEAGMGTWESFDRSRQLMEDFSTRTLAAIPSDFGRLIYLASLRDLGSGRYSHAGLEALYPPAEVQETLARAHCEICESILEAPLAGQEKDLTYCLRGFEADSNEVVSNWRELESYRALLPLGLPGYIRDLFCSNIETLLSILEEDGATSRQPS